MFSFYLQRAKERRYREKEIQNTTQKLQHSEEVTQCEPVSTAKVFSWQVLEFYSGKDLLILREFNDCSMVRFTKVQNQQEQNS